MGLRRFFRRQKIVGVRKLPERKVLKKLLAKMPQDFKSVKAHSELVRSVAANIALQLAKKGIIVDSGLLDSMALAHDSFRHLQRHERIAQNYFARKGFPLLARGVGRHTAASLKNLRHFSLEEKILYYSDEVSRWNPKNGSVRVLPLNDAIESFRERYKNDSKMLEFIEKEKIALEEIEKELLSLGINLKQLRSINN